MEGQPPSFHFLAWPHNGLAFSCEALLRPPRTQAKNISRAGRSVRASGSSLDFVDTLYAARCSNSTGER